MCNTIVPGLSLEFHRNSRLLPRLPAEGPWLRAMGMKAGPLGRRRESSRIAVSSPSCEKGSVGTLHLTNKIVFAGSTVHRSRGEKHERSLDTGALRWSRVVCCEPRSPGDGVTASEGRAGPS